MLRAQLVTADGRLVTATAEHEPELFWALRGAGRNFGVVTTLEIRLAAVAKVYGGTATFPVARAHELLATFRELAPHHPDELTVRLVLSRRGPGANQSSGCAASISATASQPAGRSGRCLRSLAHPAL